MLTDKELSDAASQLEQFRLQSEQYRTTHVDVLQNYSTLIEDYKRLQSDYEEERDARERYKQLAKGQERNPFVLVLVDGDGYIFDDDLVSSGAEGGQKAAQLLNGIVKQSLRNRGLDNCRIMVRIYANLAGLSKALSKSKLCGAEKRSLAPFTASFTRSNDLFDFVDAGDLKENADYKIRAMFRQFVDNAQCRHIFLAACHDVGYVSELTPYSSARDRITLIRNYAFHPEFAKLGLRVEDFPNLFRTTPLDSLLSTKVGQATLTTAAVVAAPPPPLPPHPPPSSTVPDSTPICSFDLKGNCAYGQNCRYKHVNASADLERPSTAMRSAESQNWRAGPQPIRPVPPAQKSLTSRSPVNGTSTSTHSVDFASALPTQQQIPEGCIAVNSNYERLDFYIPTPPQEDRAAFFIRHNKHKLCNNYHLCQSCPYGDDCEYDHSPITQVQMDCLRQLAVLQPCPRKSACRVAKCSQGHICQRSDCRYRGGKASCKMPAASHTIDLTLAMYVTSLGNVRDIPKDDSDGSLSAHEDMPTPAAQITTNGNYHASPAPGSDSDSEDPSLPRV